MEIFHVFLAHNHSYLLCLADDHPLLQALYVVQSNIHYDYKLCYKFM